MITKKNKEQFENWYFDSGQNAYCDLRSFYLYPLSMQWGVYLEYYDSLRVNINALGYNSIWAYEVNINGIQKCEDFNCSTRQEAQTEALNKADEIVNSRL